MLFGKSEHLVGLDIGSGAIKVCDLEITKRGFVLKKFGTVELVPGAIVEGIIHNHEAVANAIRELFSIYNIRDHNVAIAIGGYSVIVKTISVQRMADTELQETIQFEAEQYIPFDISDVNIDFQILDDMPPESERMNVILVAAKKDMVDNYLQLTDMAGLNPCVMDVDAFALQNIYELLYRSETDPDEQIALIDVGTSKITLNVIKGENSLFLRDISFGCGQINRSIADKVGCSLEEAEVIKHSKNSDKLSLTDMKEIISATVSDWCTEISRAFDFFYSTNPDSRIKKVVLSGGGANIIEFKQLLAPQISAEVEVINPFKGVTINNEHLDSGYLEQMAPQAAICMGLAIRKVDDK
ncbi:MAG: pilus assembly protein PilM [Proteobacteria bacterium]|nr:pilus assembly protein PilM [Pseudomonadota bacterium]